MKKKPLLLLATNKIAIYVAPTENRVDACSVAASATA